MKRAQKIAPITSLQPPYSMLRPAVEHEILPYCEANGIGGYGGGQTELGVGRGQIQYLASLFHADAPNDVAPAGFNLPEPPADLPSSPLPPTPSALGFRWD